MVGVHAVAGGEDVGQVGAHGFVDDDGAFGAEFGAGVGGQFGVGAHADDDEDEIDCAAIGWSRHGSSGDGERAGVGAGDAR